MFIYATTWLALSLMTLAACNSNKPQAYSVQRGAANSSQKDKSQTTPGGTELAKPIEVVLDTSKLLEAPGAYSVELSFTDTAGASKVLLKQAINPSSKSTTLTLSNAPTAAGLLTVSLSQGEALKFIAKRSNTSFVAGKAVVVDDCLVLPAPWGGGQHDGSCEWTVEDVKN